MVYKVAAWKAAVAVVVAVVLTVVAIGFGVQVTHGVALSGSASANVVNRTVLVASTPAYISGVPKGAWVSFAWSTPGWLGVGPVIIFDVYPGNSSANVCGVYQAGFGSCAWTADGSIYRAVIDGATSFPPLPANYTVVVAFHGQYTYTAPLF